MGDCKYTYDLMMLNGKYLDYYIFPAGIMLKLPDAQAEAADSGSLPPWKQVAG